jgi:arsenate reductase
MAEGFARALKGDVIEAYSAGVMPVGVNLYAIKVMHEVGIDISNHRSKDVHDLLDIPFDYIVTVCGYADIHCPAFPGKTKVVHHGFDDPPTLASTVKSEKEALDIYRRVRDEIKEFIEKLPGIVISNK